MRRYWMVGNRHEGCGHFHRTKLAATRCLARIARWGGKRYKIYHVNFK